MSQTEQKIAYFDQYVLRIPVWPFEKIYDAQNQNLEVLFVQLFSSTIFKEAIFLASPNLFSIYEKWIKGKVQDKKKIQKLHLSLLKYYLRMSSRCTPFGLFAGCSTGTIADDTKIILPDSDDYERHTRMDMGFLNLLTSFIISDPVIKRRLNFFPNNSIYKNHDKVRFVEYEYTNRKRNHNLICVDNNEYLQGLMALSREGALIGELVEFLKTAEIDAAEAEEYIAELVDAQILVSELEPTVTGPEFYGLLVRKLKTIRERVVGTPEEIKFETWITFLEKIQGLISNLDRQGAHNPPEAYYQIMRKLEEKGMSLDGEFIFQTDMVKKPASALVSKQIVERIAEVIPVLACFTELPTGGNLIKFADAFYERYEEREVKLVEALDTDIGIGYKMDQGDQLEYTPFLNGFDSAYRKSGTGQEIVWTKLHTFWLNKYIAAKTDGKDEIIITESDIIGLDTKMDKLPVTFSVMASIQGSTEDPGNEQIYLYHSGGSSAVNLLGRFCHADIDILNLSKEIAAFEEEFYHGKLLAEIVHLPEARIGNILLRPLIRNFEIPYLAQSAVPKENQIGIDDLYVSVRDKRIILRSAKRNMEVIPRLSSAHNFESNALPVYQFLCDLQLQSKIPGLSMQLGVIPAIAAVVPRITYKNVILQPKTWNFHDKDIAPLLSASKEDVIPVFNNFARENKLPNLISLVEFDNELILNLKDENCIKLFISEIRNKKTLKITESLACSSVNFSNDQAGCSFCNQFIFSFKNLIANAPGLSYNKDADHTIDVKRDFMLGDEWLYIKIYVSNKSSNRILTECIGPLSSSLLASGVISKWFFIRYYDPKAHLKVRFLVNDKAMLEQVIAQFNLLIRPYVDAGLVWRIQSDTYLRELERYGANNIKNTEEIFFRDSVACVAIISGLDTQVIQSESWFIALKGIDGYLEALGLDLNQKHQYISELRNGFLTEFEYSDKIKEQVNKRFRDNEKRLSQPLQQQYLHSINTLLYERDRHIKLSLEQLTGLFDRRRTLIIVQSYIHMFLNRFFTAKQRLHEFVLYCLLEKHYFILQQRNRSLNKVNN